MICLSTTLLLSIATLFYICSRTKNVNGAKTQQQTHNKKKKKKLNRSKINLQTYLHANVCLCICMYLKCVLQQITRQVIKNQF